MYKTKFYRRERRPRRSVERFPLTDIFVQILRKRNVEDAVPYDKVSCADGYFVHISNLLIYRI